MGTEKWFVLQRALDEIDELIERENIPLDVALHFIDQWVEGLHEAVECLEDYK